MEDKHPIARQETEQPSVPVHTGSISTFPDSPIVTRVVYLQYCYKGHICKITKDSEAATTQSLPEVSSNKEMNELVKRRTDTGEEHILPPLCHICCGAINSRAGFTLKNALLFWRELRSSVISREEAREFLIGCLAACGRRM